MLSRQPSHSALLHTKLALLTYLTVSDSPTSCTLPLHSLSEVTRPGSCLVSRTRCS